MRGITLRFEGTGKDEKGIDEKNRLRACGGISAVLPTDGCCHPAGRPYQGKARAGLEPKKTSFEKLVQLMVAHDMKYVKVPVGTTHIDLHRTSDTAESDKE